MQALYFKKQTYEKQNYTEIYLPKGEYEHCIFINCNF